MASDPPLRGGRSGRGVAVMGVGAAGIMGLSALSAAVAGFDALERVRPRRPAAPATIVSVVPSPLAGHTIRVELTGPGAHEAGWVGLVTDRGRLLTGPAVDEPDPDQGPADTVLRDCRPMPGVAPALLEPGTPVVVAADPWQGCADPLGLRPRTHRIATHDGPLALTSVGARHSRRAVVFVHGRGGARATGWWLAPVCERLGWRCEMSSYRNDPDDAPATGRYLLGGEWVDLVAVLDHLAADGVEEVVLAGWSMGGNICASYLRQRHRNPARFAHHPRTIGLVLDAAALDWGQVLSHVARARRLPHRLAPLSMAYGQLARRVNWRDLNHLADPEHLDLPVLAYHGVEDAVVPVAVSRTLAATLGTVHLEEYERAGHCRSVNVDPDRYLGTLEAFLAAR